MRVFCDAIESFADPAHFRELQRLVMSIRLGQHDLILGEILEEFVNSSFFLEAVAAADRQEVLELLSRQDPNLANRGLDPCERSDRPRAELLPSVEAVSCQLEGSQPVWRLGPSEIGKWASAPLRVLLENDNDWSLVESAARVYARAKVLNAVADNFLLKDHRGGTGEIVKSLEKCSLRERIFILMDSDKTSATSPEGHCQIRVRELLLSKPNATAFILAKREAENYLPRSVWHKLVPSKASRNPEIRAAIKKRIAWEKLDDSAKDFVDLESYFGAPAKRQLPKLCNPAYVPTAEILEERAGRELIDLLDLLEKWL